MNDHQLEKRVVSAFENACPDVLASVLEQCGGQAEKAPPVEEKIIHIEEHRKKRQSPRRFIAVAAMLALIIGLCFSFGQNECPAVDSVPAAKVFMDVNPSIEFTVNADNIVLEANALNDDGQGILADLELQGRDINTAVDIIMDSMVQSGYLSASSNSVLVSVESLVGEDTGELESSLQQQVSVSLGDDGISASVLSQNLVENEELASLSAEFGVSPGKAGFVYKIACTKPEFSLVQLIQLNVNQLNIVCQSSGIAPEGITFTGSVSLGDCIASDVALQSALEDAGLVGFSAQNTNIQFDFSDGKLFYDISFGSETIDYKYDIDAVTGEIIQCTKEFTEGFEKWLSEQEDSIETWAEDNAGTIERWALEYAGSWEVWLNEHAAEIQQEFQSYAQDWEVWVSDIEAILDSILES